MDPAAEQYVCLRQAIDQWHERLEAYTAVSNASGQEQATPVDSTQQWAEHVQDATDSLVDCLLESDVAMPLVSQMTEVLEMIRSIHLMGIPRAVQHATAFSPPQVPGRALSTPATPASAAGAADAAGEADRPPLRASGVALHQTSIGRRASSSYNVYDRIGGWEALSAAVGDMVGRMCADPRLEGRFVNQRDEERLKTQTLEVMTCAFGGRRAAQAPQSGASAAAAVPASPPGITGVAFDIMMEHLKGALEGLNLPADVVRVALAILRGSRGAFSEADASGDGGPAAAAAAAAAAVAGQQDGGGKAAESGAVSVAQVSLM